MQQSIYAQGIIEKFINDYADIIILYELQGYKHKKTSTFEQIKMSKNGGNILIYPVITEQESREAREPLSHDDKMRLDYILCIEDDNEDIYTYLLAYNLNGIREFRKP